MKKTIAICIPCFNEESNIDQLYNRIIKVINYIDDYSFSILFEDNCSTDNTLQIIKYLASIDKRVGYISNLANFGFVRSSANILLAPDADANILLLSDLQDPPEEIPKLIYEWEHSDSQVVFAVRKSSKENSILFFFKTFYYSFLSWLTDKKMVRNCTGYGIYEKSVVKCLRETIDSYPFIKGLVCTIGFKWSTTYYVSNLRSFGKSTATLPFLIDFGVLGIVTSSRKPIRIITYLGGILGCFSLALSIIVSISKIIFWDKFAFGIAMISVSTLFFTGIILFSLGVIGEYIGFIHQRSLRIPLIVEKERFNIP